MVREGRGANIRRGALTNAIVIMLVILTLIAGFIGYAVIGTSSVNYARRVEEEVRHQAEKESEVIRIYLYSHNHTLNGLPKITIVNVWGKDSQIKYLVALNKTHHPIIEMVFNPPLNVPASGKLDLEPASIGLNYQTYREMADNLEGIYLYTVAGNSFGSTWGYPREENIIGTQTTIAFSTSTTKVLYIPNIIGNLTTVVSLYETLPYPEYWDYPAVIVVEDNFEGFNEPGGCYTTNIVPSYQKAETRFEWQRGWSEKPPTEFKGVSGAYGRIYDFKTTTVDIQPMLTWYLLVNPPSAYLTRIKYELGNSQWEPVCEYTAIYALDRVEISASDINPVYIYSGVARGSTTTTILYPKPEDKVSITVSRYTNPIIIIKQNLYGGPISTTTVTGVTTSIVVNAPPLINTTITTGTTFTSTTTVPLGAYFTTTISKIAQTYTYISKELTTTLTVKEERRRQEWVGFLETYVYVYIYSFPYTTTITKNTTINIPYTVAFNPVSTVIAEAVEKNTPPSGNYTHLYFKLTMPYYKITKYYKFVGIDVAYYSKGGEGPNPPPPPPPPKPVICNVVRKSIPQNTGSGEPTYEVSYVRECHPKED
ncbi:MAG: hypothetical protein QXP12_07995 [Ignisphaera sp.]